ncbi:hypothetical protein IV102_27870 [bacterium]|nr:hypothetical protein [bacterium]
MPQLISGFKSLPHKATRPATIPFRLEADRDAVCVGQFRSVQQRVDIASKVNKLLDLYEGYAANVASRDNRSADLNSAVGKAGFADNVHEGLSLRTYVEFEPSVPEHPITRADVLFTNGDVGFRLEKQDGKQNLRLRNPHDIYQAFDLVINDQGTVTISLPGALDK